MLGILLVASFLRFWQLGSFPPGLYHDEAYNGLDALSLTQGAMFPRFYEGWELYALDAHAERPFTPTRFPVFFEGNYGREPLHVYLMALSIRLFGPTPFAIRAVPAAAGVLAVFTTYLAAAAILEAGDWRLGFNLQSPAANLQSPTSNFTPLFAAATLAVLYPAVHFSRFGIRAMLFLPIETMAVYCFWRGIAVVRGRRGRVPSALWFAGAGLFLGAGLYTFSASRLLPLLFVLFVPLWLGRDWTRWRLFWRPIGLMATVSLLTVAPLLWFFWQFPYFFIFRIAYVSNKGAGAVEGRPFFTWLLNVGRVVRGLYWQGETHLRHNLPGRPFFDPLQAFFFTIGGGYVVRLVRQPRYLFLLLWFLIMLLPSVLSGDAPHFGRLSGAAPAGAMLVGLGMAAIGNRLSGVSKRLPDIAGWPIANDRVLITTYGLLLAISLGLTTRDYFWRYAAQPQLTADFQLGDWELGRYAAAQPANTALYLTPTQEEMATIYFALADPERLRSYDGAAGLIPAGRPGEPALYLLRPEATESLAHLVSFFPDGQVGPPERTFVPFGVTAVSPRNHADQLADHRFANPQTGEAISLLGWSQQQTDAALTVTLYWRAETTLAQAYTAFVHLSGADGVPLAQVDRPPAGYPTSDWRPGEVVVDQYRVAIPTDLAAGHYLLRTGFYYLPTLELLGMPYKMSEVIWEP